MPRQCRIHAELCSKHTVVLSDSQLTNSTDKWPAAADVQCPLEDIHTHLVVFTTGGSGNGVNQAQCMQCISKVMPPIGLATDYMMNFAWNPTNGTFKESMSLLKPTPSNVWRHFI